MPRTGLPAPPIDVSAAPGMIWSVQFRPDEETRGTVTAPPGSDRRLRKFPLRQRALLRGLTAELASLQERVEAVNLDTFKLDDDLQSLSEFCRPPLLISATHKRRLAGWRVLVR